MATRRRLIQRIAPWASAVLLTACGSAPVVVDRGGAGGTPPAGTGAPAGKSPGYVLKRGGGFYQDDGPGANPPADIGAIPDAVPRAEPLNRYANKPYSVLGRDYVPMREVRAYREHGVASWYGRKFNGQKTASGEIYDMYAMTAAHPTLPIPSFARVTNPANGRSVVVRVNDRGPFHAGRVMDLSYSAAWKLGLVGGGSGVVDVESIVPGAAPEAPPMAADDGDDPIARLAASRSDAPPPVPEVSDARGTWLQLGAFGNADNAESLRQRLATEFSTLGDRLVVRVQGTIHRVQLGPYRDAAEAARIAARIRDALDANPLVISR